MSNFHKKITDLVIEGASFLETQQQKDGSFLSFSSTNPKDFLNSYKYHSTFSSSLILSCLCNINSLDLIKIKQRIASFLLIQKSKFWSFNYWIRGSKESKIKPYPDDLDDTFCALAALLKYDPKLIDGEVLANIVSLLTNLEQKEGGPYRTWLVSKEADKIWRDVDLAVNANIAYFLSLKDIDLPNINRFIEGKIKKGDLSSPYYPSSYPLIYFISRFYKGKFVQTLEKILLYKQDKNGCWENPLNTALAVSSLINLGYKENLNKAIRYLIQTDIKKPYGFCIDPSLEGQTYFSGSSSLTLSFCLEALSKYLEKPKNSVKGPKMALQVIKMVKDKFPDALREELEDILKDISSFTSSSQISLMSFYFRESLNVKNKISDDFVRDLGQANLLGWMAYTIYDDFLDEEGDVKKLSIANIALRELTTIFDNILPTDAKFKKLFHKILNQMDAVNTWEVKNCRVKTGKNRVDLKKIKLPGWGNNKKLATRAMGHGLGPLAILFKLGYKENSSQVKNLTSFFTHFLIAKQLNDDAHDWEKDLKLGHINPVVEKILIKYKSKGKSSKDLKKIFWFEVILDVCEDILRHTKLARKFIGRVKITDHNFAQALILPIENSANQALYEQKETVQFLKNYI